MSFVYERRIHFSDTDAAGVVYFARYLALCHEAYEEALAEAGLELAALFQRTETLVPVARCEADYKRSLACGDRVRVVVSPRLLSENSFEVGYEVWRLGKPDKLAAAVRTEHVCIWTGKRGRAPLPEPLAAWVEKGRKTGAETGDASVEPA